MSIILTNPTGRNTKAHILTINGNEFFFSYQTCIAFRGHGKKVRLANHWGPTTGRHFKELGCKDFGIVSDEEFASIIESII